MRPPSSSNIIFAMEGSEEEEEMVLDLDEEGRFSGVGGSIDFSARSTSGLLDDESAAVVVTACQQLDLRQQRKADQDLDATFWIPSAAGSDFSACILEQVALEIFRLHTTGVSFDADSSGVEWWVQVRRKHTELSDPEEEDGEQDGADEEEEEDKRHGESIPFHFDTDEVLGSSFGVHASPHLSTVTYLTDWGAPTIVLNKRCEPDGTVSEDPISSAFVSFPRRGKSMVFDGRYLHAAPQELRLLRPKTLTQETEEGLRVSLLVNVWLNHQPLGIDLLDRQVAAELPAARPGTVTRLGTARTWSQGLQLDMTADGDGSDETKSEVDDEEGRTGGTGRAGEEGQGGECTELMSFPLKHMVDCYVSCRLPRDAEALQRLLEAQTEGWPTRAADSLALSFGDAGEHALVWAAAAADADGDEDDEEGAEKEAIEADDGRTGEEGLQKPREAEEEGVAGGAASSDRPRAKRQKTKSTEESLT